MHRYGYISTSDCLIFLRLDQHTPSVVEYYTIRRPQGGSSLPSEQMLPTARVMLLALLSASDWNRLTKAAAGLIQRNNHRWPLIRASATASPTSRGSAADDLGRSRCTKRKRTPEDDRAAEPGDVDSSKRPKLQNANDQIDDTAKPSLDARSLPTPPPANSSLASSPGKQSFSTHIRIDRVPCCTTKCILGVVRGGPMDPGCPNTHGDQHPSAKVFRQTLHDQLTQSPYEDYMEMYMYTRDAHPPRLLASSLDSGFNVDKGRRGRIRKSSERVA